MVCKQSVCVCVCVYAVSSRAGVTESYIIIIIYTSKHIHIGTDLHCNRRVRGPAKTLILYPRTSFLHFGGQAAGRLIILLFGIREQIGQVRESFLATYP